MSASVPARPPTGLRACTQTRKHTEARMPTAVLQQEVIRRQFDGIRAHRREAAACRWEFRFQGL